MIRSRQSRAGRELERLLRDGVRPALSDARLLERYILHRDEPAFEALVERHGPMVLSLCRRCLRDPRDVEDAFQATFLVLVRKGSGLRDADSLSSWLYGVAYRVASRARSDVMKRRTREGEPEKVLEAVAPPVAPYDDSLEALDAELSRLPEKYRAPLVLCYLEGRTHEQAAAELDWPVGTVRSRMARGRAILESRLTRRGLDASAFLALARPDLLSPSLNWTIPASLVRSTLEGVGRFVGVATLGAGGAASFSTASLSWPATALAQGVLSAMMISQLKWIGLGTAALGVLAATAGMSARAVSPRPTTEDGPAKAPASRPAEAKAQPQPAPLPSPSTPPRAEPRPADDVQVRLADMERKIDRLTKLLSRLEEVGFPQDSPKRQAQGKPLYREESARRDARSPFEIGSPIVAPLPVPVPSAPAAEAAPAPELPPVPQSPDAPAIAPLPPSPAASAAAPTPQPLPPSSAPTPTPAPEARELPAPSAAPGGDVPPAAQPLTLPPSPASSSERLPDPNIEPPAPATPTPRSSRLPSMTLGEPAPAVSPARPATTDALAALVLAPRDRSGVREIEALLQNLYKRQQRNDALMARGVISYDESIVPTELARVLVARLREMEDEFELDSRDLERLALERRNATRPMKPRFDVPSPAVGPNSMEPPDGGRRRSSPDQLESEIVAKERELERASVRVRSAQKLIAWAQSHFKELKLAE